MSLLETSGGLSIALKFIIEILQRSYNEIKLTEKQEGIP
jgi:hypothetical protein